MPSQNPSNIEEYRNYWDTSLRRYVLVRLDIPEYGSPQYAIHDTINKMAVIIENNDLAKEIKARMIDSGVPIVKPNELEDWNPDLP